MISTKVTGRVSDKDVRDWESSFKLLRGARFWLFEAEDCTGYETVAVDAAAGVFSRLHKEGSLGVVVAILTSRMVRMGASLVAMISKVPIEIVGTKREADAIIQRKREAPR